MRTKLLLSTLCLVPLAGLLALRQWITAPSQVSYLPPITVSADAQRLQSDVAWLSSVSPPRFVEHPEVLYQLCESMAQRLQKDGLDVEIRNFTVGVTQYPNLIAGYGSKDKPIICFVAHLDVCGPYPGADDNASGVAALLELGRLLGSQKPQLDHRVELAVVSLEEPPYFRTHHMGSYHLAQDYQSRNLELAIALDCVGYFSDEAQSQSFPLPGMGWWYSNRGNFITVAGHTKNRATTARVKVLMRASGINTFSINAPRSIAGIDFSDHLNFWDRGMDAVFISDTAFYRNPHYHLPSDAAETLDYRRLAQVATGLYYVASGYDRS